MGFSLAHLSDPHLPLPCRRMPLGGLGAKQALALLAWRRRQRRSRRPVPAAALVSDLAIHAPDHLAVTGDLVNLALPTEFLAAREWLAQVGSPHRLSVVPGNHDLTVAVPWQSGLGRWEPWMQGDPGTAGDKGSPFPFLRRRGPLALVGLCSGIPTPPFSAAGRLGTDQLARLEALLRQAGDEHLFRVVLIHHPPIMGRGGARKALRDRGPLCAALRRAGAELVLHGHHHVTRLVGLPGPRGLIPLLGVPAALADGSGHEIAGWHLHRIERLGTGWRLTTTLRRYDPGSGRFRQAGEWSIELPG